MSVSMHADAGARALGALPPDEAASFDRHVADCEQCADEYAGFLATTAMLAAAVAEPPPDGLRYKVMQAAAVTPQLPPLALPGRQRRTKNVLWWRRPISLIAAAAVAATIAGVAVVTNLPGGAAVNETVANEAAANDAAAQCVSTAHDSRTTHPSVGSGGSVSVAPSCAAAVIHLAALPALAPGRAYQLWLLAGDKARSAGMVAALPNTEGRIVVMHLNPQDSGVAVSIEPAGGSKQPTSTPVWVTPLGV